MNPVTLTDPHVRKIHCTFIGKSEEVKVVANGVPPRSKRLKLVDGEGASKQPVVEGMHSIG